MDTETHEAVKSQARREGMIFTAWILRLVRRTLGLSDEVPAEVHEISLEDRMVASVKRAGVRKLGLPSAEGVSTEALIVSGTCSCGAVLYEGYAHFCDGTAKS